MQTTSGQEERFRVFPALMVVAMILLAAGQAHLLREVRRLHQRADKSASIIEQANASHAREREIALSPHPPANRDGNGQRSSAALLQRNTSESLATLEQRVNDIARAIQHPTGARAVAEYNVMSPPIGPDEGAPPVKPRAWGEEQIVGPPDTPTASDARTAWAPREQNAGPEWLAVDFPQAVDVAEVRIRETYNPGAISKVTGIANGQEIVLWEGTASGGAAPRDFVVPVQGDFQANSLVVHLDTARVPGWNEIDAVELVGKDGSRQWAQSVTASSTYADARGSSGSRTQIEGPMPMLTR